MPPFLLFFPHFSSASHIFSSNFPRISLLLSNFCQGIKNAHLVGKVNFVFPIFCPHTWFLEVWTLSLMLRGKYCLIFSMLKIDYPFWISPNSGENSLLFLECPNFWLSHFPQNYVQGWILDPCLIWKSSTRDNYLSSTRGQYVSFPRGNYFIFGLIFPPSLVSFGEKMKSFW